TTAGPGSGGADSSSCPCFLAGTALDFTTMGAASLFWASGSELAAPVAAEFVVTFASIRVAGDLLALVDGLLDAAAVTVLEAEGRVVRLAESGVGFAGPSTGEDMGCRAGLDSTEP